MSDAGPEALIGLLAEDSRLEDSRLEDGRLEDSRLRVVSAIVYESNEYMIDND